MRRTGPGRRHFAPCRHHLLHLVRSSAMRSGCRAPGTCTARWSSPSAASEPLAAGQENRGVPPAASHGRHTGTTADREHEVRHPGGGDLVRCPSCRVRVIASSTRDTRRASALGPLLLAAGLLLLASSDRGVGRRDGGRWLRRRWASCSRCGGRSAPW